MANNRFRAIPLLKSVPEGTESDDDEEELATPRQLSPAQKERSLTRPANHIIYETDGSVEEEQAIKPHPESHSIHINGKKMDLSFTSSFKSLGQDGTIVCPPDPVTTERTNFISENPVMGQDETVVRGRRKPRKSGKTQFLYHCTYNLISIWGY
ncbi:unnamed protein product [Echinostoma caproni]|uniref:Uncharacterized protein n=1 Tax=Echinostoma caproni TaxID=27848 RepID=A0A3P8LAA7_9TREM|nr:unnamed protein product [Echinostoma caproni]